MFHFKVNLGVFEENPSTTVGTCAILDNLLKYVPVQPGGQPMTIPCHGDGLTIDRIMRAKRNRRNHPEPLNRFDGMEASPQECIKRAFCFRQV